MQEKLRNELRVELEKNNGKITYEMVAGGLPYLNQFIKEITRMYSSVPFLDRLCQPPNGESHYSLEPFSDFKIPAGMPVYIPLYCLQRDPQYFPDPEKFNPDRFDPRLDSVNEYTYMPFGLGPRICIGECWLWLAAKIDSKYFCFCAGERFGKMQVSVGIIQILRSFRVQENKMTPKKLVFDPESVLLRSLENICVSFVHDEL